MYKVAGEQPSLVCTVLDTFDVANCGGHCVSDTKSKLVNYWIRNMLILIYAFLHQYRKCSAKEVNIAVIDKRYAHKQPTELG